MNQPVKILKGKEAREALIAGINVVADAVKQTLGPKSRNVAINQSSGVPKIIHDGISIARSINLKDEFQDMGAQLLKEASSKTNETAGDGTTTAAVLTQALVNQGNELVTAGTNPMTLKDELEEARDFAVKELKKLAKPIKTDKEVEEVASISSASAEVGKLVADTIKQTGTDGLIDTEIGNGTETTVEFKQGIEIDKGYKSSWFRTSDEEPAEAVIDEPYILITDKKINNDFEIVPFLNNFIGWKTSRNLVIVGDLEEQALAVTVLNKVRGVINILVIQTPGWGDERIEQLEDLALLTNATVITNDSGRTLDSVILEELGQADKIKATSDKTTIYGGKGSKALINEKIENVRKQVENAATEYKTSMAKKRLAKLTGTAAIIHVGATTEVELSDKRERIIDAINACKASIKDGIVSGGQLSYLSLSNLTTWPKTIGSKLLQRAIKEPFKVLVENSGLDYAESISKISPVNYPFGIDVNDGQVKDLIYSGVIEPVLVEVSALENAVSVAATTLTTSVLISEEYNPTETK